MSSSNSKLSSKLKQLRFMQRAAKKQEQEEVADEEQAATKSVSLGVSQNNWIAQASKKMCVVLRTSDPAPMGLGGGKMSFGKKLEPIDVEKEQEDAVMLGLTDVPKTAVEMKGKKRKQQESHENNRLTQGMTRPNDGRKSKHGKQHRVKTKN